MTNNKQWSKDQCGIVCRNSLHWEVLPHSMALPFCTNGWNTWSHLKGKANVSTTLILRGYYANIQHIVYPLCIIPFPHVQPQYVNYNSWFSHGDLDQVKYLWSSNCLTIHRAQFLCVGTEFPSPFRSQPISFSSKKAFALVALQNQVLLQTWFLVLSSPKGSKLGPQVLANGVNTSYSSNSYTYMKWKIIFYQIHGFLVSHTDSTRR